MRAHILYYNFLKPDGEGMSIGGIQTYITNLIPVLRVCGYDVTVYQRSDTDFYREFETYDVYGIGHAQNYNLLVAKALLAKALSLVDPVQDLLLYGCETCIVRRVSCKTIAIQHGISWDIPLAPKCSRLMYMRHFLGKCCLAWRITQRVKKADFLVCVDNNFVNWYRAVCPYPEVRHIVIPNFTSIPETQLHKQGDTIHIIFARRFFPFRGTRLFVRVIKRILLEYENIQVTIAGTGPDEEYIRGKLGVFDCVHFTTFKSEESLDIHRDMDVAIVPTIGSEGTSLSLLEAMASGCAVVCTNVGGMTNIVLDGYNGLMINPDEESLYNALKRLIDNPILRKQLQDKAYETVCSTFALANWRKKWAQVIRQAGKNFPR